MSRRTREMFDGDGSDAAVGLLPRTDDRAESAATGRVLVVDDYRQARVPTEQFSFGRIFRLKERYRFQIRAEFFNAFNRIVMPTPSSGNPLQTATRNPATGVPTAGFGRIDASSVSGQRNGQFVARLEW